MTEKRAAFLTLGCKVNAYDTEAIMEIFEAAGYTLCDFSKSADVYVVNTCTVTHMGDRKSRQMLRRARRANPEAIIVAMGCYAQVSPAEVAAIPEVDIILGTMDRKDVLEHIEQYQQDHSRYIFVDDIMTQRHYENLEINETKGKTRAFIKVQEGCNRFCTYCIVPYARGPVRSRSLADVVAEAERVRDRGYKEIVITGIHITSYGIDFDCDDSEKIDLTDLVSAVAEVDGIERIRLGSLEPLFLTDGVIEKLAAVEKLCPHFHLSLQSGCDTILARMKRRYTTKQYLGIVRRLREAFGLPAITTDIMVGFPGETAAEFEKTLDFVETVGFYQVHCFKYSKRKGTPAADYPDQVPEEQKNDRAQKLKTVSERMEKKFLKKNDERNVLVLYEKRSNDNWFLGHTPNYIPVYTESKQNLSGQILPVNVSYNNTSELYMHGLI